MGELKKKVCVRDEKSCSALPCLRETGNNRQQSRGRCQAKPALQPAPRSCSPSGQNQKRAQAPRTLSKPRLILVATQAKLKTKRGEAEHHAALHLTGQRAVLLEKPGLG